MPRAVPPGGGLAVPAPATNLPTSYFSDEKTEAQASRNDRDIPPPPSARLKDVMPYLYKISVAQPGTALRLAFAVCFMLVQKSTGLAVPILFKTAVDHLTAAAVFSSQADAAGVSAALRGRACARRRLVAARRLNHAQRMDLPRGRMGVVSCACAVAACDGAACSRHTESEKMLKCWPRGWWRRAQ